MKKVIFINLLIINAVMNTKAQTLFRDNFTIDFETVSTSWCNDMNDYYMENKGGIYNSIYGVLSLQNISDTTLCFWMMSCSWTDQIKVIPTSIRSGLAECDSNAPIKIKLKPKQKLILNSQIEVPRKLYTESTINYNIFQAGHLISPLSLVFN